MKRLKATMHPISFWTSLTQVGGFILVTTSIFSRLDSMPWWLMILPKRILDGTPKMQLVGFNFHWYSFKALNVSMRSAMRLSTILD
jgi:hypothetical protein